MPFIFFQKNEMDVLIDEYEKNGYVIIDACFKQSLNIYDVFSEIKKSIPLDPPLYSRCNFDALSDSIYGGLGLLESNKLCVFLVDIKKALVNDNQSYNVILDIIYDNLSLFESEGKSIVFFIS
ncbi:hypothetical protein [Pectobacterium polaris]|uniref:hypothetical protein n=1 Tax=Pectobacterium polaris TaxID=2042057 RepID=UPI002B24AC8A|nr:hypothetical protein [Pectobacterium polaris]